MKNMIEVSGLVKNYGSIEAVKGISFSVAQGAFFAFLGVNGAGKSTTINILSTVLEKTGGKVFIGGCDLDRDRNGIKNQIGIVFQNSVLDGQLTVGDNLFSRASLYGLSRKEAKNRISQLTEEFELEELMRRKYYRLSGGQRRRVDIARALINRPGLLFLDEPTTGLDPMTRVKVWEIIDRLRHQTGLTVFLTTHYMEETAGCDNVVILDDGKIAASDTPHRLKEKFASNRLIWYTPQTAEADKKLTDSKAVFTYSLDSYKITLGSSAEAIRLIEKTGIDDFEFIRGSMDDVFLNITGKRLGD